MRRRTRPRVVWLPQTNANSLGTGDQVYQLVVQNNNGVTGARTVTEIPLVLDSQTGFAVPDVSLADIELSGYRLRRIVGKIWCQMVQSDPSATTDAPAAVIITAGIIVRRADTTTGASLAATVNADQIDPGLIDNSGDPWVWRRSWVLGDNGANTVLGGIPPVIEKLQSMPTQNWGTYGGGIAEGPHVDQKTARVVGPEERLFLDLSMTILSEAQNPNVNAATCVWFTDLRVLGSMTSSIGNRNNSSR